MKRFALRLPYNGSRTEILTYLIVLISLFCTFFSFLNLSFGLECIILSFVILALNFTRKHLIEFLPFVIICGVVVLLYLVSGQTDVRGFNAPVNHMLKFVYLMFTMALSIGMRQLPKGKRSVIVKWLLFSVLISALLSSYSAVFLNRYAIRYPEEQGFRFVVNFGQLYGMCFILCALVFAILCYKGSCSVWKQLLACFLIMICIVVSLYVTGLLLTVLGIGLGFAFYQYDKSKTRAAVWAFVIVLLIGLVFLFGKQVSDWIYHITQPLDEVLRDRLRNVADTLFHTNHGIMYSHDRREALASYSLASFAKHPLFGVGYREYKYGVIGGHQEWQDLLGVFGLAGMIVFVGAILYFVKVTIKSIDNKVDLHAFYIAVILFLVLGFLNPCMNLPVLIAVFIVAPYISHAFQID